MRAPMPVVSRSLVALVIAAAATAAVVAHGTIDIIADYLVAHASYDDVSSHDSRGLVVAIAAMIAGAVALHGLRLCCDACVVAGTELAERAALCRRYDAARVDSRSRDGTARLATGRNDARGPRRRVRRVGAARAGHDACVRRRRRDRGVRLRALDSVAPRSYHRRDRRDHPFPLARVYGPAAVAKLYRRSDLPAQALRAAARQARPSL